MNEHATIHHDQTSLTAPTADPGSAPSAAPGAAPATRRRSLMRRLALAAALAAVVLLTTARSSVLAFGDIQVRIGGLTGCLPDVTGTPISNPICPDHQIIAGSQTAPHGPSTLPNHSPTNQDYEDRFIVTVTNLRTLPPSSEPVVFEYRAPAYTYITGIGALKRGTTYRCEVGTETDPAPVDVARCDLGQMNPLEVITITIEFYVDLATGRETLLDHDMRAYLVPIGTEEFGPNNQDHFFQNVTTRGDLRVLKIGPTNPVPFLPNEIKAGTCETFRLEVKNNGPSVSQDVFLGDTFLPDGDGLTITAANVVDTDGGACDLRGPQIGGVLSPLDLLCELGDIGPGDVREVNITVCADSSVPDGKNFANVAGVGSGDVPPPLGLYQLIPQSILPLVGVPYPFTPEPCDSLTGVPACLNNVTAIPIVVHSEADLAIEKSSEPDKVNAGEQKEYTITVTNNGPSDALNVEIKDVLPPGVAYEIDDASCDVRERMSVMDPFNYVMVDSLADPLLRRDGLQNDFRNPSPNGDPITPLPIPYLAQDPMKGYPFFDISASGTSIKGAFAPNLNDGSANVALNGGAGAPFVFNFYDLSETSLWVSTNGYVKFGSVSDTTDPNNDCPLSDSTPNRAIYAFWDDLDIDGGDVFVQTVPNPLDPPQRVFIVQWHDVPFNGDPGAGSVTFQLQLYEGSNQIRLVYDDVGGSPRASGMSATVGIEPRQELVDDDDGGITYACGDDANPAAPFLEEGRVIAFNRQPEPDELVCRVGEQVKDGSVPAEIDGFIDTGCDLTNPLGCIFDILDLDIQNDKINTFRDGSPVTHVMKPGDTRTVVVRGLVDPALGPGTTITNTAVVTGFTTLGDPTTMAPTGPYDPADVDFQPFGGNNMAASENLVLQLADLKVTKFGKPDGAVRAGEILTYTIIVDNLGPSWADNVAIKDILQSSGTFDLIDINSDRRAFCNGDPGPHNEVIRARDWPLRDAPPAFGVDDDTGVEDIENRLELDCTLDDDPGTPEGDETKDENTEENRLEVLAANGPPNDGRWIVTMRVRARETQDINNIVDVLSDAGDPDPSNNHDEVEHDITDVADLAISKTDSGDPFVAGTEFDYLIEVENKGPSTAENVVVQDTLPLGLTVVDMSQPGPGSCGTVQGTAGNTQITCDLGLMAVGSVRTITVRVLADPDLPDGTVLWNQAIVSSDIFDDNNRNNISRARSLILARADLGVTKVDDPDPVLAGEVLEYRVTVVNHGPSNARDVVVVDTLSPWVAVEAANVVQGQGLCLTQPVGAVTCQLGKVAAGATVEIAIRTRVDQNAPCGTEIYNDVAVASTTADPSPDPTANSDRRQTRVNCQAGLAITKTASDDTPVAGSELRYTITVTNNGPSVARNVRVRDDLHGEMTYLLDTYGCGASLFGSGCGLGDLAVGQTVTFDMVVAVEPDAPCGTTLPNVARALSSTADTVEATANVVVACASDLWIRKFGKPDGQLRAGETLDYYVTVTNLGPSDTVPSEVYFRDLLASDGTFRVTRVTSDRATHCDAPVGTLPFNGSLTVSQSRELRCTLDEDLNPNEQWLVQLQLTADEAQTVNNTADVYHARSLDPVLSNNHAEVAHDVTAVADLELSKDDNDAVDPNADPFKAGQTIDYQLSLTNDGPSTAENVVVLDTLPLGLRVTKISQPGQGSCGLVQLATGNIQVRCNLGSMVATEVRTASITVQVPPEMPHGTILWNEAVAYADTFDDDNSDNVSRARSDIVAEADLGVTKVDLADPVLAGQELEYRVEVKNYGPSLAREVTITDELPEGLEVLGVWVLSGRGVCQPVPAGFVTCYLDRLPAGAAEAMVIRVRVDPAFDCAVDLVNRVTVASATAEPAPDPHANSDSRRTDVRCQAVLAVTKTASDLTPVAGEDFSYAIEVTNNGPSVARSVVVRDFLPPYVSYVTDTAACGPALVGAGCGLGDLAPGQSVRLEVVVRLAANATCRTTLTNRVRVSSPTADAAETTLDVAVDCASDLWIRKFGKPDGQVRAGDDLTYYVHVTNLGPSATVPGEVYFRDFLASDGSYRLTRIWSDRPATCNPPGVPLPFNGEIVADQTLGILCVLNEALAPNDQWLVGLELTADEPQTINDAADVYHARSLDPVLGNNHAEVEHDVTAVADLSLSKDDNDAVDPNADPFKAGETIDYALSIINHGPSTAENAVVVDTLPLGLVVEAISAPGAPSCATLQPAGGSVEVRCNLGRMAVAQERTVTIRVRIPADFAPGTVLWNEAVVYSDLFDDDNKNNISRARSDVIAEADLGVEKTDEPDPVLAGEMVQYTLVVRNWGPSQARNVMVSDDLPPGLTVVEVVSLGGRGVCQPAPVGFVTCQFDALGPGAAETVVILARVDPAYDCAVDLVNRVTVSSRTAEPSPDPHANTDSRATDVQCRGRLYVRKTVAPNTPVAGENLTYTIVVRNDGPSVARAVRVRDVLPAQMAYVVDTQSCGPALFGAGCDLGDLAVGETVAFDVVVRLQPSTPCDTLLTNAVTATASNADPATDTVDARSACHADLKVTKFGKPDDQVRANEVLTYTVVVDNLGPSWAPAVALKDILQSSGAFELLNVKSDRPMMCGFSPNGGTPADEPNGNIPGRLQTDCLLLASLGVLEPAGFPNPGRWILTVRVRADEETSLNNIADVTSPALDPNPGNNHAEVAHAITDVADLKIDKDSGPSVVAGTDLGYTITVTNRGPSTAENVTVFDRLPPGIVVKSATVPGGRCRTGTAGSAQDQLVCQLGTMALDEVRGDHHHGGGEPGRGGRDGAGERRLRDVGRV